MYWKRKWPVLAVIVLIAGTVFWSVRRGQSETTEIRGKQEEREKEQEEVKGELSHMLDEWEKKSQEQKEAAVREEEDLTVGSAAYIREIMGDWEYLLADQVEEYLARTGKNAGRVTPVAYGGYLEDQKTHLFYLYLDDDREGIVLLARYHPYTLTIEEANRTLEEILAERKEAGDSGLPKS